MTLLKLLLACLVIDATAAAPARTLPKVDLGYQIQQASGFNPAAGYYNFSNIRYGQPPLGNLRFAAPVAPTGRSTVVNTGDVGTICPNATPLWLLVGEAFITSLALGKPFNATEAFAQYQLALAHAPALVKSTKPDPRTTEDCLFLDVIVPKGVFENRKGRGAAVMVWIYGGGYTEGDKAEYNPTGLIKRSQASGSCGIIYVAMNYRLGAFGWLSGPTFQADGTANAGLYDQRLALEWVQKYIHLFGGDPDRVTVFGESAGGGSIMHQITAFGGLKRAPFQQALPQSPGWIPSVSAQVQEDAFNGFLKILGVKTLQEARKLPSATLIAANALQVASAQNYGSFIYGPTVDGAFAPELPGRLLLSGQFDHDLKIMVGHNADEGALFSNPFLTNNSQFNQFLAIGYPGISQANLGIIENVLYPPVFDGSFGYASQIGREIALVSESTFTCNTNYLARAFGNNVFSYEFSIPPAFHGMDVNYTYYNDDPTTVRNPQIAIALQEYITSFAETGVPSGPGLPKFPVYGPKAQIADLNITGITTITDTNANPRCLFWQKAWPN